MASLGWFSVWLWYRRRASKISSSNEVLRRGIDCLSEGFAIYDAKDRLVTCNASYRGFFGRLASEIQPGREFPEILQMLLDAGMIEDALGREEAWFENRMKRHAAPQCPFELRLDGRWVEVREDKQPDGFTSLIIIDISAHKALEASLRESEERYRGVVEDQTELICRALPDGTVTFVNSAYCRFFGGTLEDWIGRSYLETLLPEEREREIVHLRSLVRIPRTVSLERRSINAAGEMRWLEWTDRLLTREDGAGVEIQSVGHDITDRKAVEEALLQSEQRYRQVVDDQTELIRRFHPNTVLTFVNEAYCRYLGKRRDELLGRPFLEFLPEEEHESMQEHLRLIAESDEAVTREVCVTGPQGERRWQLWTEIAFRNDQGRVVEYQSVGRDITARKVVEERFRAFVDNAPAAISIKDRSGYYVLANRRFAELAGKEPAEIVGKTSDAMFPRDFAHSGRDQDAEVLVTGKASVREETLTNHQGTVNLLTVKFPLLNEPGEVGLVAAIHTDITRLKQVEAQLEIAKEQAEKASAAKTRFLAAASHDLRQPLHAMRLLIDTMRMNEGAYRREEIIEQIGNAVSSMSLMLNALLDIGELESGAVRARIVDFRIDPVLENLVATVLPSAELKGLEVRRVPTKLVVRSDPVLLARILDNFLSNAVRYTASGRVLVGCRRSDEALRIEVWDSGRGIPEDSLEAVFEDYRQLGNLSRDRSQGLGLGLGIAQRLARLLGHEVAVRSWLERGSVFTVEVPLGSVENLIDDRDTIEQVALRSGPASVLIVEDDPLVAEAAAYLLRAWGITVHEAGDAEAALDCFQSLTVLPEVVIADYRLPHGETGLSVIERIRERYDPSMPAIVVTGDISSEIMMEAEASGCELLRKPVEPGKLRALLRACVAETGQVGVASSGSSQAAQ